MTVHHLPYGEVRTSAAMNRLLMLHDRRAGDEENRIVWRRSLVDHARCLLLETDHRLEHRMVTKLDSFRPGLNEKYGWRIGPIAFEPPATSRAGWRRLLVRDAPIALGELRRFHSCDRRLATLGVPEDVGSNCWVAAPYEGKTILIPSLSLLAAVAFPSAQVWQRLSHPLSMDLVSRRSPADPHTVEIASDSGIGTQLRLPGACLYTLAFWLEENRLPSLHRGLEGFGRHEWALVMPDRPERLSMGFDGYESDELIVVQRIRALHSARFFPGDWRRVVRLGTDGKVADAVEVQPFATYAERRGLPAIRKAQLSRYKGIAPQGYG